MARKYDEKVDAAIKALALEEKPRLPASEIRRRLADNEAELGKPIEVPLRTVQEKAAKYRELARLAGDPLQDVNEIDAADAMTRDLLRLTLRKCRQAKTRIESGENHPRDPINIREWTRTLSEIRKHYVQAQGKSTAKPGPSRGGQQAHRSITPASTLERLTQDLREPASTRPLSSQTSQVNGSEAGNGSAEAKEDGASHSVSDARDSAT